MKKHILPISLFLLICSSVLAQDGVGIMLKTYPIRYIYGVNIEGTYTLPNYHQISLLYQHHDRDWVSVRDAGDELGISAIPFLEPTEGYTFFASYLFPLDGDSNDEPHFWFGPKLGGKDILAYADKHNLDGIETDVWVDQTNGYVLGDLRVRNKLQGFIFEAYIHAGAVNVRSQDTHFEEDGSIAYIDEKYDYWLPHFLVGFCVGWGF